MLNIQGDQETTGQSKGQPNYIDRRRSFILPKMTECGFEIVFKHRPIFKFLILRIEKLLPPMEASQSTFPNHSVLKLFTGFASADLMALCPAVIQAMTIEPVIANKNIDALSGIRYV